MIGGVNTISYVTATPYPFNFTVCDHLHIFFPCCRTSGFETASLNVLRVVNTSISQPCFSLHYFSLEKYQHFRSMNCRCEMDTQQCVFVWFPFTHACVHEHTHFVPHKNFELPFSAHKFIFTNVKKACVTTNCTEGT